MTQTSTPAPGPASAEPLDPVDVAIGARIRSRRADRGITQAQLAAAAGVTFQQIQKYERGTNRVAAGRLLQIAAALETTGADLLGELEGAAGEGLAMTLAAPGVARLVRAWKAIPDPAIRDAILVLAVRSAAPLVQGDYDAGAARIVGASGREHSRDAHAVRQARQRVVC